MTVPRTNNICRKSRSLAFGTDSPIPRVVAWLMVLLLFFCGALFVMGQSVTMFSLGRSISVHISDFHSWDATRNESMLQGSHSVMLASAMPPTNSPTPEPTAALCEDHDDEIAAKAGAHGASFLSSCANVKAFGICGFDPRLKVTCCVSCGFGKPRASTITLISNKATGDPESIAVDGSSNSFNSSIQAGDDAHSAQNMIVVGPQEQTIYQRQPFLPMSFMLSVQQLWDTRQSSQRAIAAIIFLLSGAWPHLKLLLLLVAWCAPLSRAARDSILRWTSGLGKFSLVDPLVVMLIMAVFSSGYTLSRADASSTGAVVDFAKVAETVAADLNLVAEEKLELELAALGPAGSMSSMSSMSSRAMPMGGAMAAALLPAGRIDSVRFELGMHAWAGVLYFCGAVWLSLALGAAVEYHALRLRDGGGDGDDDDDDALGDDFEKKRAGVESAASAAVVAVRPKQNALQPLGPQPRRILAALSALLAVVLLLVGVCALPIFTREIGGTWGMYLSVAAPSSTTTTTTSTTSAPSRGLAPATPSASALGGTTTATGTSSNSSSSSSSSSSNTTSGSGIVRNGVFVYDPSAHHTHSDRLGFSSISRTVFGRSAAERSTDRYSLLPAPETAPASAPASAPAPAPAPAGGDAASGSGSTVTGAKVLRRVLVDAATASSSGGGVVSPVLLGVTWLVFAACVPLLLMLALAVLTLSAPAPAPAPADAAAAGAFSAATPSASRGRSVSAAAAPAPASVSAAAAARVCLGLLPGLDALAVFLLCCVLVMVEVPKFAEVLPAGFCAAASHGVFEGSLHPPPSSAAAASGSASGSNSGNNSGGSGGGTNTTAYDSTAGGYSAGAPPNAGATCQSMDIGLGSGFYALCAALALGYAAEVAVRSGLSSSSAAAASAASGRPSKLKTLELDLELGRKAGSGSARP